MAFTMDNPCIPVLHLGTVPVLRKRQDICSYLVRHFFLSPGFTSDYVEDELVAFRTIEAEVGKDSNALADAVRNRLGNVLRRYFPEGTTSLDVQVYDIKENPTKYGIKIEIADADTLDPVMLTSNITVKEDTIEVTF